MKEAFELIKERLEEKKKQARDIQGQQNINDCLLGWESAMAVALYIVSEVEAEYGNGWIDVKYRLPENDGYYLTCDHKGNIHVFFHSPKYMEIDYAFGIGKNHSQYYQPIAWKELPKPYTRKKGV